VASSADPPVSLHQKPAGAPSQGDEAADQGGEFSWEEALVKLLCLVFSHLNERLEGRRLRGFAEALAESYPVA